MLRKVADQAGLTAGLGAALHRAGRSPVFGRGVVLVSMAAAIALGATSMSDIAVLAHLAPVLGAAPGGPTARQAVELAGGTAMLERIATSPCLPETAPVRVGDTQAWRTGRTGHQMVQPAQAFFAETSAALAPLRHT